LHAVDERLAAYGWLTTTGVKFLVVVDLMGQQVPIGAEKPKAGAAMSGLRDGNLKPVCPHSRLRSWRTQSRDIDIFQIS